LRERFGIADQDDRGVVGAFVEPGEDPARVAVAVAGELKTMGQWLGLSDVTVGDRGDLVTALRESTALG
jgi:hypothetical protein